MNDVRMYTTYTLTLLHLSWDTPYRYLASAGIPETYCYQHTYLTQVCTYLFNCKSVWIRQAYDRVLRAGVTVLGWHY